jgi:formamidopyrimidine-DNA glycosylase
MPELPEVETVARGLAKVLDKRLIKRLELHRPDLRFPIPPGLRDKIEGKRVVSVGRRAKYLLIHMADGTVLIAHLGMSGRMTIGPASDFVRERHDHVVITTEDDIVIRFNDARRFGFLDVTDEAHLDEHPMLRILGPEPLGNTFNGPVLATRLAGKMTPIKAALLDQKIVAGLGNIYVSEALYQASLSPLRLATTVQGIRAERLATAIKDVLGRAIAAGGSSLRDYVQTSGELGYFQHHWAVYGREGEKCPTCTCTEGIRRIVQSNRSTFYCAKRQR